ncbi:MAG TPA: hypothetical protein DCX06_12480 [Opitutae bacterium]|nr:hypothetical protein [Opitutae bacterium]
MKNKIAIASAFLAASSFSTAEIVINDFLSFEGFIDMSYYHVDGEYDKDDVSENSFQIDQVEISWLFDFDPVTAQIDLQYEGGDSDTIVEQAFATYHFDNGGAITAGRYASMLGFEAFEPTGLYQYSFAYDLGVLLPGYNQGVKYTYETDSTFFGISLQDSGVTDAYDNRLGGNDDDFSDDGGFGVEVAGALYMDNGLSFFLGGAIEDGDNGDSYIVNSYVTFETGAWIFAGEVNYGESDFDVNDFYGFGFGETEIFSALIMANFAYSDAASITARVSYIDGEDDGIFGGYDFELIKYTLAHGYAFTDNLFLVTEVSYADGEIYDGDEEFDALSAAVELIFSF